MDDARDLHRDGLERLPPASIVVLHAFPAQRDLAMSAAIIAVYTVTIAIFDLRWRRLQGPALAAAT